jgi:hypothetical protein
MGALPRLFEERSLVIDALALRKMVERYSVDDSSNGVRGAETSTSGRTRSDSAKSDRAGRGRSETD